MQPSYIYIVVTTGRTPLHEQLFCRCEQRLFRVAAAEKTEQPHIPARPMLCSQDFYSADPILSFSNRSLLRIINSI